MSSRSSKGRSSEPQAVSNTTNETTRLVGDQSTNATQLIGIKRKIGDISECKNVDDGLNQRTPGNPLALNMSTALKTSRSSTKRSVKPDAFDDIFNESNLNERSSSLLSDCLGALLYQDGEHKPLTHSTLKRIEDAKSKLDVANALFLDGIGRLERDPVPSKILSEAEEKGCNHPILYYFLGQCHSRERSDEYNEAKAIEYYMKAIAGM